jgi:hypothetical protein
MQMLCRGLPKTLKHLREYERKIITKGHVAERLPDGPGYLRRRGAHEALAAQTSERRCQKRIVLRHARQDPIQIWRDSAVRATDWEQVAANSIARVHYADAVVLVGGFAGTYRAANWAGSSATVLP